MKFLLSAMSAFLVGATALSAQTVTNGSFEDPTVPAAGYTTSAPTGYTFLTASTATTGAALLSSADVTGGDGSQYLYINVVTGTGDGFPTIYQNAGALAANTTYVLTVAEAAPGAGGYQPGTDGFTIALYNTSGAPSADTLLSATSSTFSSPTSGSSSFTDETVSFTTGADVSGDLTFGLEDSTASGSHQDLFDNVRLTATPFDGGAVPEPSTYALLGLGSMALLFLSRRQRA